MFPSKKIFTFPSSHISAMLWYEKGLVKRKFMDCYSYGEKTSSCDILQMCSNVQIQSMVHGLKRNNEGR